MGQPHQPTQRYLTPPHFVATFCGLTYEATGIVVEGDRGLRDAGPSGPPADRDPRRDTAYGQRGAHIWYLRILPVTDRPF